MSDSKILPPGSTIGILGGGQLGRMTAMAAARLGYRCIVYAPDAATSPGAQVSAGHVVGDYSDTAALERFAKSVDVVTYEFENVAEDAVRTCERHKPVRPGVQAIHYGQHRLREKAFFTRAGIGTTKYEAIDSDDAVAKATTFPGILKTCTEGYDGKGQARVKDRAELAAAFQKFGKRECILEAMVDFVCEISVIVARSLQGEVRCFPIGVNEHRDGILRTTTVPADLGRETLTIAERYGTDLANKLDLVGLVTLELFVGRDGQVLANEMAPRPHNSGHWTIDACATSQFEQLVRAICGLPLGSVEITAPSRMENLIGAEVENWPALAADPTARLHLYGKTEHRPGRKMGHVTFVMPPSIGARSKT